MKILYPFTREHLQQTFEWVNDPELSRMMNYTQNVSMEEHQKWYSRIKEHHIFAITVEGSHVGNCCLKNHDTESKKAELWLYIGEMKFRKKGFGRMALEELINYGFHDLKLNKIFLYFLDYNEIAEKIYRQTGFKFEGRFRKHFHINGEYRDAIYMSLLKEEWPN